MRFFIILISLLGLTACSQKSAKVKLELTSSFSFGGTPAMQGVSEGGLMVWGLSKKGDSFSRVLNNTNAIELELSNDKWTFTAVAWKSTGGVALDKEELRCARSIPMDLKGEQVQVNLELRTTTCADASFRGGITNQSSLKLVMCQNSSGVSSVVDKCTHDANDMARKSDKSPVGSVRLRMMEFDNNGSSVVTRGPGLSRCVPMASSMSGEWMSPTDLAVPVGDPTKPEENPFRIELDLYWDSSDCANGTAFNTLPLPKGLVSPSIKFFPQTGDHVAYVSVPDSLVCSGRENLATFPGGDGTKERPWLICSAKHLYQIHNNTTYLEESFRLAADIDLNPFSKGLTASAPAEWPSAATSWEVGQNWQPIGYNVATGFQGSFFGGGHAIAGMRMRLNQPVVGFVGLWDPPSMGEPHQITDLVFLDPEVEGISKVGAVVGYKNNSNSSLIANIEVRGGSVSAGIDGLDSNLGGIAGSIRNTGLINLKTSRVKIEGEGQHIGGIFGYSVNSHVLRKLVSHSYVGSPEWATSAMVGGIGGYVESTELQIDQFGEWASESIVVGRLKVGGLLGDWGSTNQPLKNVYAAGSITIRGQGANNLGGLFGTNDPNATLDKAYFAGSLLSDPQVASTCNVGWLSGYAYTMTRTNTYVMSESSGGHNSLLPRSGFGDDTDGVGATESPWAPTQVGTSSIFTAGAMSSLASAPWVHRDGDKPRLVFEKHPCSVDADAQGISPRSSLATQKAKWGTATKPMMICRKDQFAEISTELGSGKVGLIMGALNLASSAAHVPPNVVSGAYLTGEGGYIHGLRRIDSPAVAFDWAPFGIISGVLENLLIAGVELRAATAPTFASGSVPLSSISGVAKTNNGSIKDVKFLNGILHHDDNDVNMSGLVGTNAGVMTETDFEGTISAGATPDYVRIAGLANTNTGNIQDSEAAGRILLANGGRDIGGVSRVNHATGKILRVSVRSKLSSPSTTPATAAAMVAVTNTGTIQDVHVTSEAYWRAHFSNNVGQIAVSHSGGSVKRVIVEGFLYDMQNQTSKTPGASSIFQTVEDSTHSSIFAVPAGRLIKEASPLQIVSCGASGQTLVMGDDTNFFKPQAFENQSIGGSGYFEMDMLAAGKLVWAVFDNGNGNFRYAHVIDWDDENSASDSITLSQTCSAMGFGTNTRIRFVQDYDNTLADATGQLTNAANNFVGFTEAAARFSTANLVDVNNPEVTNTGWNQTIPNAPVANTVIARGAAGTNWILSIFGDYINTGSTTRALPIWEVDGNTRINLFRVKK